MLTNYDPEDHVCIYCGAYQMEVEDRPIEHIAVDLVVTHRHYEHRRKSGADLRGIEDDRYDLLCELDAAVMREAGITEMQEIA